MITKCDNLIIASQYEIRKLLTARKGKDAIMLARFIMLDQIPNELYFTLAFAPIL